MAKTRISAGSIIDAVSPAELGSALHDHGQKIVNDLMRNALRGLTPIVISRTVSLSATEPYIVGSPRPGYTWSILSVNITGDNFFLITDQTGETIYSNTTINGLTTYGKGAALIRDDMAIAFLNSDGTSSALIYLCLIELPTERIGELYL